MSWWEWIELDGDRIQSTNGINHEWHAWMDPVGPPVEETKTRFGPSADGDSPPRKSCLDSELPLTSCLGPSGRKPQLHITRSFPLFFDNMWNFFYLPSFLPLFLLLLTFFVRDFSSFLQKHVLFFYSLSPLNVLYRHSVLLTFSSPTLHISLSTSFYR